MLKDLMTLIVLPAAVVALAVVFFAGLNSRQPIDIETPNTVWIPQAIFVSVCGKPVAIIVTTEPLLIADEQILGTPEMEVFIQAARKADLAYKFDIVCPRT